VVDIGIGDAARHVEQAASATRRDTETATQRDRFVDAANEGVAGRGGAESGRIFFRIRQRALDQQAGDNRAIADALVETDARAITEARLVVAAAGIRLCAIRNTVTISRAECVCACGGGDHIAVFAVAIGVEDDSFARAVVDSVEPEVPADIEAVEELGFGILRKSRLSESARENRGCQICRFFHWKSCDLR